MNQNLWETYKERTELFTELFSERLQDLRKEKNWKQTTVAKKLGVPVSTYANWEQGRRQPGIYDIFNILWVFDIEANELFSLENALSKSTK